MNKTLILTVFFLLMAPQCFAEGFTLTSPDIQGQLSQKQVFSGFGCSGKNISPELHWKNAPENTKSFAVTVYDPDAPTGSGWWHWVIFDIPVTSPVLLQDAGNSKNKLAPQGSIQGVTDFGSAGYGGACPPAGDNPHQYIFTVYALDTEKLGVDAKASPALVGFFLHQHTLAKASLVAYYSR